MQHLFQSDIDYGLPAKSTISPQTTIWSIKKDTGKHYTMIPAFPKAATYGQCCDFTAVLK